MQYIYHFSFLRYINGIVLLCVFTFLVPCSDVRQYFRIKTIFDLSLPPLFVGRFMSYLCYLCLLCIVVSLREAVIRHRVFQGFVLLIYLILFALSYYVSLRSQFRILMPHTNDVLFVVTSCCLQEFSCLIYIICVCVQWFRFVCRHPVSCVPDVVSFSGLSIILLPLLCSLTFIRDRHILSSKYTPKRRNR